MTLNFAKSLINNLSFELDIVLDPTPMDYARLVTLLKNGKIQETDANLRLLCRLMAEKQRRKMNPIGWTPRYNALYTAISKIRILTMRQDPGQMGGKCCGGRI
jgi:hypothetical protein